MGKNPAQLNQKQVDVLEWIKDGCPDGVYQDGYEHRIIARALEHRGLITISGRGVTWSASITPAGAAWLAAPPAPVLPPDSDADLLIDRVLAADGRLVLAPDREVVAEHERLIRMSLKSPRRPHGKKLAMQSTGRYGAGPKEIVFVEHFDDYVDAIPVPVPIRITHYHPSVRAFLDDKHGQYVTKPHLSRAARLLQAITAEAPNRGIDAAIDDRVLRRLSDHERHRLARGHLVLRTPRGYYSIKVRELGGPNAPKKERRTWNPRPNQPAWIENRDREFISTGRLELTVDGPGTKYDGDHYRDAKTTTVEQKLPDLFRSLEVLRLQGEWEEQERQTQGGGQATAMGSGDGTRESPLRRPGPLEPFRGPVDLVARRPPPPRVPGRRQDREPPPGTVTARPGDDAARGHRATISASPTPPRTPHCSSPTSPSRRPAICSRF